VMPHRELVAHLFKVRGAILMVSYLDNQPQRQ
jgi:hypothetical protein